MNDPAYPANFAVQAILLSAFTLGLVAWLRRPERRAGMALVGILACGVIPFVSAFAPVKERVSPGRVIRMEAQPLPPLETMIPINFPEPVADSSERLESALPPPAKLDPVFWIPRVWMVGMLAGALLMIGELFRTSRWLRALGGPDDCELMVGIAFFTSAFGFARAPQAAGAAAEDDMSWLEPKPIVHVRAMAVIAPEPFAPQGEVLTNEELEKRLARDVRKKGFHFQILPTESMPQGSMLTVHLTVNRDSSITDPPWDGGRIIDPFVGWVVHYESQVAGEGVRLGVRAAYAFPPGTHPAPGFVLRTAPPSPFGTFSGNSSDPVGLADGRSWNDVTMVTANESALVRSGQILCTSLGEIEKGLHAVCLTGVVTRMPWDHSSMLDFPALEPPSRERKISVVTRYEKINELTAEQKALSKRIEELRRELLKKVDSNPVNESLLKLRTESEAELAKSIPAKDKDKIADLQWRIQRITKRMQERCGLDYEVDRLEIMRLDEELHRGLLKRITERRAKPDPSKFNNNEL